MTKLLNYSLLETDSQTTDIDCPIIRISWSDLSLF